MLSLNSDLKQEIKKCARCGYCRETDKHEICPVRSVLGFESSYARGKLNIALLCLTDNKIQITRDIVKIFYLCTLCGNCLKHCPLSIDTPKIMSELRYRFLEKYDPLHDPIILKNLVTSMCHNSVVISNFIAKKGKIEPRLYLINKNEESYLLFSGCMNEFNKGTLAPVFKIFDYLDISVIELKQRARCCGFPFFELGHRDRLFSKVSYNMDIFNKLGYKKVIINCPGCLYVFKTLNSLGSDIEFVHLTEFLNDQSVPLRSANGLQVTYHDPCLLGRHLGIYEAPRNLLSKIGITIKEMPRNRDNSLCCGGGTLSMMYPDYSKEISMSRVAEAKATGSSILLTSCPLCRWNLARGNEHGMEILEITDLLAKILR